MTPQTMERALRLLILEDVPTDAELVHHELRKARIEFVSKRVETREGFLREILRFAPDAVLADYNLPQFSGLEALRLLRERRLDVPFILVTGAQSEEVAVQCIKEGADDYILKTSLKRLPSALLNSLKNRLSESEREKAMAALQQREEQFRLIAEHTQDLICLLNADGQFFYISPSSESLLGYAPKTLIGADFFRLVHPDDREAVAAAFRQTLESDSGQSQEFRVQHQNGDWRIFELIAGRVLDSNGTPQRIVAVSRDITKRRRDEETIRHLAYYDALTGLPNRALFNDRLALAIAHSYRNRQLLGLMFLDMDRFKTVNDTLGHVMGDRLLQGISERLKTCLREGDTIARLGGDEFMLLLPGVAQIEDIAKVAQRILEALKTPFPCEGHDLHITTSIGIALYPNDSTDGDSLLKNADIAMYRAKEQGRNNYQFYTPGMNASAFERLSLENNLRRALERDEFVLYYQAQLNLRSGRITGAEALIRWQHPDLGLLLPSQFIPVAEETGLIIPLGEWVLNNASAQNKMWQGAGLPPVRIAVNLSPLHFKHKGLTRTIAEVLAKSGLEPGWLELELTESTIMQNVDATILTMIQLQEMGVHVSIDDFGTGYSSLSYLKRFPINTVKIDQSFIRDITTNSDDAAIAKAIIGMAHSLNLRVIAEGVETREQLAFLQNEDCDEVQGFFFSQPLPAEEFSRLLKGHDA
jgi:diguanylate cyclase (GGDEF)-like protein/PAS domain S-box-containing protein